MNALILASLAMYTIKVLPLVVSIILLSIALTRWMICVHELFHIVAADSVHPLVRLILIPFTPFNIGYDEYRKIHMGHHKYDASELDPEVYHIRGTHWQTFFAALSFPEQSLYRYTKQQDLKPSEWRDLAVRLVLFLFLMWFFKVSS